MSAGTFHDTVSVVSPAATPRSVTAPGTASSFVIVTVRFCVLSAAGPNVTDFVEMLKSVPSVAVPPLATSTANVTDSCGSQSTVTGTFTVSPVTFSATVSHRRNSRPDGRGEDYFELAVWSTPLDGPNPRGEQEWPNSLSSDSTKPSAATRSPCGHA